MQKNVMRHLSALNGVLLLQGLRSFVQERLDDPVRCSLRRWANQR
jgi:hypothetical protein